MKFFVKSHFLNKKVLSIFAAILFSVFIIGFSLFSTQDTKAWTQNSSSTWGDGTIYNVFINSPSGTLSPGATYYLQVSASANACDNRAYSLYISAGGNRAVDPNCHSISQYCHDANYNAFYNSGGTQVTALNRNQRDSSVMTLSNYAVGPFTAPSTPGTYNINFNIFLDNYDNSNGALLTGTQTYTVAWPSVTSSCIISTSTVVTGQNVTWTSSPSGGTGTYTYTWNGDVIGNTGSVINSYSAPGIKQATVSVSSNNSTVTSSNCTVALPNKICRPFGATGDKPISKDFDGDGQVDVAIFRPVGIDASHNLWSITKSSAGWASTTWGVSTDIPVPGDYDKDGKADVAIYRQSGGVWSITRSSDGVWQGISGWGSSAYIPVPGDYDGDGKTDMALYNNLASGAGIGNWYFIFSSGSTPSWLKSNSSRYCGVNCWQFGSGSASIPIQGDYDGDGKTDVAVFYPSTTLWYIEFSSGSIPSWFSSITTNTACGGALYCRGYGITTDTPVPADYDGDGKTDMAVYRSSTGYWYSINSSGGGITKHWGGSGTPAPADYDGDHKADLAVFYPSTGNWYIDFSSKYTPAWFTNMNASGSCSERTSVGVLDYLTVTPALIDSNYSPGAPVASTPTITGQCGGKVNISWNDVQYADSYDLYRDSTTTAPVRTGISGTSTTDTVATSTSHKYAIKAKNGYSSSLISPLSNSAMSSVECLDVITNVNCSAYWGNQPVTEISTSTTIKWKSTSTPSGGDGSYTYSWSGAIPSPITNSSSDVTGPMRYDSVLISPDTKSVTLLVKSGSGIQLREASNSCSVKVYNTNEIMTGLKLKSADESSPIYVNKQFVMSVDMTDAKDLKDNGYISAGETIYSWDGVSTTTESSHSFLFNTVGLTTVSVKVLTQSNNGKVYSGEASRSINVVLPSATSTER